jgi:3-hydroxyacyl-[acyl-carrier-protein] dehydratase
MNSGGGPDLAESAAGPKPPAEQDHRQARTGIDMQTKTELGAIDIHRVLKLLPHRYPFLMIDKIKDIDGDKSAIGIKNVTINEPHFQGHFPDFPVMPGVLLVEGMAQTVGALAVFGHDELASPRVVYMTTIDKVKFRKPVVPGDTVEFHVTKLKSRGTMCWYRSEAKVDGVIVAEGEVGAMLVDQ